MTTSPTGIIPSSSWFIRWLCNTDFPVKSRKRVRKVTLRAWGMLTASSQRGSATGSPWTRVSWSVGHQILMQT